MEARVAGPTGERAVPDQPATKRGVEVRHHVITYTAWHNHNYS